MTSTRPPQRDALPSGTVTFMFTDVEGSTRLLQTLGDAYGAISQQHADLLRQAVQAAGGIEVSTEGDSFFVVFDDAASAVAAAVAAQRALARHEWPDGADVRVRMGLHTGQGRHGGDNYVGLDVNRAARIAAAAHGGQVVVSSATKELVQHALPEGVTMLPLGEHRLKDLEHPVDLYQLSIGGLRSEFPPVRSVGARPNNLPPELTSFVGREAEIAQVVEAARSARLLTLTGPGGTGKTRLSLRSAAALLEDFRDGVFFVGLAAVEDPMLIAPSIARALGIHEEGTRDSESVLADHLRDRELLLVLDNFEQVVEGATLIPRLLEAAPRLKVLVTSRESLRVAGEQELPVPPLALPDVDHLPDVEALSQYEAVELFIQRASAVKPGFEVTSAIAPAIAQICVRLDGLPLAIELAAARVKLLGPDAILKRLENRLDLLSGGGRDRPDRQRTLRGAIDWSYDLLDDDERDLFARLAVFSGGWTLEAADAICTPDAAANRDVLDLLTSLVDKSLVRHAEDSAGEPRFWMLQVIREYAHDRLAERPDHEISRQRHAQWYFELAREAAAHYFGRDKTAWLDRITVENDNMRAALQWSLDSGTTEIGLLLGAALWRFWHFRQRLAEGRMWMEQLLAAAGTDASPGARAQALTALGGIVYWQEDYERAFGLYEDAFRLHEEAGDKHGMADALFNLGYVAGAMGEYERASELLGRSLPLLSESGNEVGIAWTEYALGAMKSAQGDHESMREHSQRALEIARREGDWFVAAGALFGLGQAARLAGDLSTARRLLLEALAEHEDAGDISGVAFILDELARIDLDKGHYEHAVLLGGAAERLRLDFGGRAPKKLVDYVDPREIARTALPDRVIEAAWEEGLALPVEDAVALARKDE